MIHNKQGKNRVAFLALFTGLLLSSCSSGYQDLSFDSSTWKQDQSGCKGDRLTLKPALEQIRLQLPGRKETAIRSLFGKPDAEELLERSQKIYVYYLTPGPKCPLPKDSSSTTALAVRFDALGNVREANLFTE